MNEVVTLLTSAAGHALVKSFRGPDLTKQSFSIGYLFQITASFKYPTQIPRASHFFPIGASVCLGRGHTLKHLRH